MASGPGLCNLTVQTRPLARRETTYRRHPRAAGGSIPPDVRHETRAGKETLRPPFLACLGAGRGNGRGVARQLLMVGHAKRAMGGGGGGGEPRGMLPQKT